MAHSAKKLLGLSRSVLRWFHDQDAEPIDFDALPEWMRITILSHARQASMDHGDVKGAIEESYRSIATARLGDY